MDASQHVAIGAAFVGIGVCAAALQAWLWRFPMVPDPTGRDPHGISSAPRGWTNVHRVLGYAFGLGALGMLAPMLPRLWLYDEDAWSGPAALHAALGIAIVVVLVAKVLIIRRFQRWGHLLPWLGGGLCLASAVLVGAVIAPYARVTSGASPTVRSTLVNGCVRCHGMSVVTRGAEDHGWPETLAEMRKRAAKRGQNDPTMGTSPDLAAHLQKVLPAEAEGERRHRDEDEPDEDD